MRGEVMIQKMVVKFNDYEPKDIIRFIRQATELTQREFGKSIGKSERAIQNYESGRRTYNSDLIKLICKVHNIEIIIKKKWGITNDRKKKRKKKY